MSRLAVVLAWLGDHERADEHRALHARYKSDDNAGDKAIAIARAKYPAANKAAEAVVIYPLHRPGAPGLGDTQSSTPTTATGGGQ